MNRSYRILPKADRDLNDQAYYYATAASPELGHRFLMAAHETFDLLASQPGMGWRSQIEDRRLAGVRVFRITGFERMLVLYRAQATRVDILRVVHGSRDLRALLRREGLE